MAPTTEILVVTFQALFGFWPLVFLGILEPIVWGYRTLGQVIRRAAQNLLVLWGFFAALRLGLFLAEREPVSRWIAEPTGTFLFLAIGIIILGAEGLSSWSLHREARRNFLEVASLQDLARLPVRGFLRLVTDTYRTFGHQVERVIHQAESVVDVTVSTPTGEKWIIRCQPNHSQIDAPAVRALYNLIHLEDAHRGALVTPGGYTPVAQEWAQGKPVYLYDGNGFLAILEQARRFVPSPRSAVALATAGPWLQSNGRASQDVGQSCPDCGGALIITQAAEHGRRIFGCSNYPHCRVILTAD